MRTSLFLLLVLIPATWAVANPVSDEVAKEFRDLVDAVIATGECPDPERLIHHFGSFGFDLLSPWQHQSIADRFDDFAPLLAEAQSPEHKPHYHIHALYLRRADAQQRAHMLRVLRRWLIDDIQQAPRDGSMQITGPPEEVQRIIDRTRVVAAEMLADWQDTDAAELMADLKPECRDRTACWQVLEWSRQRLTDACAGRVLDPATETELKLCVGAEDLQAVVVPGSRPYHLSAAERDHLWSLLTCARLDENSNWAGGPRHIVLAFRDQQQVNLSPTEPGRLVWTDNTSLDRRRRLTIRNQELFDFVAGLPEQGPCDQAPLRLTYASWYYDGGTVGVALTDERGCLVEFCFDHRLGTSHPGRIYLGARCPDCPGARAAGFREAQDIVRLARRVLDRAFPEPVQAALLARTSDRKLAATERKAWLLLRELENRAD